MKTESELNAELCDALGIKPRFYIMKRGLYYRPDGCGYTACENEAWKATQAEARKHEYPHDTPVTIHPAPLPNYFTSLSACHEAEKTLTKEQQRKYLRALAQPATHPQEIYYDEAFSLVSATPSQRATALHSTLCSSPT